MNKEARNPVDIVEMFLAMQNTRKEAADRLGLPAAGAEKAIGQLMNELSLFGDAVKGTGQENSEFYQIWKGMLAEGVEAGGAQQQEYQKMEAALRKEYDQLLSEDTELPASLRTVLEEQRSELNA